MAIIAKLSTHHKHRQTINKDVPWLESEKTTMTDETQGVWKDIFHAELEEAVKN